MLKTKYALSAFCMLVAMTMATSAFAQGVFTVSSSIEPRARMNSHTEASGGITLSLSAGTAPLGGTVTIGYGANVVNDVGTDLAMNHIVIDICDTDGSDANTSVEDNEITITVPPNVCTTVNQDNIDVSGVLLGVADSGLTEVTASISATGDIRLGSGANQVTVISNVVDELTNDGVKVGKLLTVIRHTGVPEDGAGAQFHLSIAENAVDSFDNAELTLDFSGIPADVTLTLDAWVAPSSMIGTGPGKGRPFVRPIATHGDDPSTMDTVETNV